MVLAAREGKLGSEAHGKIQKDRTRRMRKGQKKQRDMRTG